MTQKPNYPKLHEMTPSYYLTAAMATRMEVMMAPTPESTSRRGPPATHDSHIATKHELVNNFFWTCFEVKVQGFILFTDADLWSVQGARGSTTTWGRYCPLPRTTLGMSKSTLIWERMERGWSKSIYLPGCQKVLYPGIQDPRHKTFSEAQIWLIQCEIPFEA